MIYSIFAWSVAGVFIAIPAVAFSSFLYVVTTSHTATRGARAVIRQDEEDKKFDAMHSGEISHHSRPSQRRLLRSLLIKTTHNFQQHTEDIFSFTSDDLEIYLALAPTMDGFTQMTIETKLCSKVGLTTRLKRHRFHGLSPNQQVGIANERFNFGDIVLTELAYLDHMNQSDFTARIAGFIESAKVAESNYKESLAAQGNLRDYCQNYGRALEF